VIEVDLLNIEVEVSPAQLAEEFCNLYENGQAEFFNKIHEVFASKPEWSFAMQMHYVSVSPELNSKGRFVMDKIGEYGRHVANETDGVE